MSSSEDDNKTEWKAYYTDTNNEFNEEHYKLFYELKQWINDLLSKKIPWKQPKLPEYWYDMVNKRDINEKIIKIITPKNSDNNTDNKDIDATDEMYEYLKNFINAKTLSRLVIGGSYKIEKCKEILLNQIQWRVKTNIDKITPTLFENNINLKLSYTLNKTSIDGHGIMYIKLPSFKLDNWFKLTASAIYCTEKAKKISKLSGFEQVIIICDFSNFGWSNLPSTDFLKKFASFYNDIYWETLHCFYAVFTPLSFRILWNIASPWFDKHTKDKIKFPTWKESSKFETFQSRINKDSLLKVYGGTLEFDYDYNWELKSWEENKF